jgi:hypothetical protein
LTGVKPLHDLDETVKRTLAKAFALSVTTPWELTKAAAELGDEVRGQDEGQGGDGGKGGGIAEGSGKHRTSGVLRKKADSSPRC